MRGHIRRGQIIAVSDKRADLDSLGGRVVGIARVGEFLDYRRGQQ